MPRPATVVSYTLWHESHTIPAWVTGPTLEIRKATADGSETIWEFTIHESKAELDSEFSLHISIFNNGFAAPTDIGWFFTELALRKPTRLAEVVVILAEADIPDATIRASPLDGAW